MENIARIYNDYREKFGIPRQSGIVEESISEIVFEKEYRNPDAIKGLEEYDYIWLIWGFSENKVQGFKATVRPPRLGGNVRKGVFATRSPFRPNGLGLSSVRIREIKQTEKGMVLVVCGADLMNGTPIYDIKPYLTYTDSHPNARCGFADGVVGKRLTVEVETEVLERLPEEKREAVIKLLEQDPRPSYQNTAQRVYGICYAGYNIRFTVENGRLTVRDITEMEGKT